VRVATLTVVDPPPTAVDGGRSAADRCWRWPIRHRPVLTVADLPTSRRRVTTAHRPPS